MVSRSTNPFWFYVLYCLLLIFCGSAARNVLSFENGMRLLSLDLEL